jgi:hypothetical protein
MRSRTITFAIMALLAIGVMVPAVEATNLPTGNWNCSSNGFTITFGVTSVGAGGTLTATFGGSAVVGGYDNTNNRITFIRQGSGSDRSTDQTYVGYLFSFGIGGGQTEFVLAGHFIAFPGTGATAARPEYGWACAIIQ